MRCHQTCQAEERTTKHISGWGKKSNPCHSIDLRDPLRLKLSPNNYRKLLKFWSPKAQVDPSTLRTIPLLKE